MISSLHIRALLKFSLRRALAVSRNVWRHRLDTDNRDISFTVVRFSVSGKGIVEELVEVCKRVLTAEHLLEEILTRTGGFVKS